MIMIQTNTTLLSVDLDKFLDDDELAIQTLPYVGYAGKYGRYNRKF